MSTLTPKIEKIISENEPKHRHTLFQLKYFIINKEPTHQAKLRKTLNELESRYEAIKSYEIGLAEADDMIALLDIQIFELLNKPSKNKQKIEIKARRLERKKNAIKDNVETMKKKQKDQEEEAQFLLNTYDELNKVESLKPYDDLETNLELWNQKYQDELQLRLILNNPLDHELVKCILSLPDVTEIKQEMVKIINQIKQKALAIQQQNDRQNIES